MKARNLTTLCLQTLKTNTMNKKSFNSYLINIFIHFNTFAKL